MIIIGEKINGSIPSVAEAIANRDAELIKSRAIAQANAGATYIDCCASVPESGNAFNCHKANTIEFSALNTLGSAFATLTCERMKSYSDT